MNASQRHNETTMSEREIIEMLLSACDTVLFAVTDDADFRKDGVDRVAVADLMAEVILKATGKETTRKPINPTPIPSL